MTVTVGSYSGYEKIDVAEPESSEEAPDSIKDYVRIAKNRFFSPTWHGRGSGLLTDPETMGPLIEHLLKSHRQGIDDPSETCPACNVPAPCGTLILGNSLLEVARQREELRGRLRKLEAARAGLRALVNDALL